MIDLVRQKRYYSKMSRFELEEKAIRLAFVADSLREYIDAIPKDIELPAMPGIDREYVDEVIND